MLRRDALKSALALSALAIPGCKEKPETDEPLVSGKKEIFLIGACRSGKSVRAAKIFRDTVLSKHYGLGLCVGLDGRHTHQSMQQTLLFDDFDGKPIMGCTWCCYETGDWSGQVYDIGEPSPDERIVFAHCELGSSVFFNSSKDAMLQTDRVRFDAIWVDEHIKSQSLWQYLVEDRLKPDGVAVYSCFPSTQVREIVKSRPNAQVTHISIFENKHLKPDTIASFEWLASDDRRRYIEGQF